MRKVIIAGGSGFLGQSLIKYFTKDSSAQIIVLTRSKMANEGRVSYVEWDGENLGSWAKHLNDADLLINLAGRMVNCRYTKKNKAEIYDSRIKSTHILGEAVKKCLVPPKTWINMSTATIYRDEYDKPNDEYTGQIGSGFSVDVARKWEQTFTEITLPRTRKIAIRTAIAIGAEGDVFKIYSSHVKMYISGKHGTGRQMVSWIHEEDFYRAIMFLVKNDDCEGVYNLAAPAPIQDVKFMKAFRKSMGYKWGVPLPAWMLHIGALFIRTETELILKSRWVLPAKLKDAGFVFKYAHIEEALKELHSRSKDKEVQVALQL